MYSDASAVGVASNLAAQACVAGLKPGSARALQSGVLAIGTALPAPGAFSHRFNILVYMAASFGCVAATLFSTAVANAGVGMVSESTLGKTKRSPSVSTKKKVLFLRIGPPTDAAHWFAFEKGRDVSP